MFSLGIILGVVISFLCIDYFFKNAVSEFIDSQLPEQERISVTAFNHYSGKASIFSQVNYMMFASRANDAGLITDTDHNMVRSLAGMRLCINYENEGDTEKANRFCKWAKDDLSQWQSGWNFDEFKRKHLVSHDKKEIPDFSQAIITRE